MFMQTYRDAYHEYQFVQKKVIKGCTGEGLDGGHKGVVGATKAIEDIASHLIFLNGFPNSGELQGKSFHLGKKLCHSHIIFIFIIESTLHMIDLRPRY
jgi:hypothetical protein